MKYNKLIQEQQFFDEVNNRVLAGWKITDIFETEYGLYVRIALSEEILDLVLVWDMSFWETI